MIRATLLTLGLAIASCATPDTAPAPLDLPIAAGATAMQDNRLQTVRHDILERVNRGDLVGVAVGVAHNGVIIWSEGFGAADREREVAATPDSSFRLASLSKSIAATILFTLVEDGRVALDDRVNDLIAPQRLTGYGGADADAVTVRDLLATTGGVPHGWYVAESREALPDLQTLSPWMGMVVFPPGEVWEYSNFSLGLTELVVETVTGEEYADYARRAVFAPLGMMSSAVSEEPYVADRLVAAYNTRGERIDGVGVASPFGGLGMVSSVNDLLRYGMFHDGAFDAVGETPVGAANRAIMQHERTISPIFRLGWHEVNGDLISDGAATGANSTLVIDPDQHLVIVVLSNATSQDSIANTIANTIKEALDIPPPEQPFAYADFAAEYETPYAPTPALEGRWSGRLRWPGGELAASILFDADGAQLTIADDDPVRVSGAVFNQHGRFEGRAAIARFPAFFVGDPEDAGGRLSLQLSDGVLAGYLRIDRGSDARQYALPVFARFER